MRILVTIHPFGVDKGARELLNEFNVTFNEKGRKLNADELKDLLKRINPEIIIAGTEKYDFEVLNLCPNLKMISRAGVGVDGVDLKECKKRGIIVAYTPAACTDSVAELTIGQIINALRNTQYVSHTWDRYIGRSINQSVIGVFGCGRIGKAVIEKLQGFNPQKIFVNDIDQNQTANLKNCTIASKDEILRNADIITFHIPLVEPSLAPKYNNNGFIRRNDLYKCKPTAIIVNTSRGGIINERDLAEWLKDNPNAKAVIDTFEVEPYEGELLFMKNAFTTPHLGSCTKEAREAMERGAVEEVLNFIKNRRLTNCIVGNDILASQCNSLNQDKIKIAIIGTGYVGLVSGACFASIGYDVTCVDKDEQKINLLNSGQVPFFEPGLTELVIKNQQSGLLKFTLSLREAVKHSDVIFICVGTPAKPNGQADLSQIYEAVDNICRELDHYAVIAIKSTVPVGTVKKIQKIFDKCNCRCDVASCPEFLREGSAIDDFLNPGRIVIGADSDRARDVLSFLHKKFSCPKVLTNPQSSEMIKYSSNAFLATKISFINEIANVCENVDADIRVVSVGMGLDKRIGNSFLSAGIGYGGSCFPKDIRALYHMAEQSGYPFELLKAVIEVNNQQRWLFYKKIKDTLKSLDDKVIGIWGLAFKPNTDDLRESISLDIIDRLLEDGAKVKVYDPEAMRNAQKEIGDKITYCLTAEYAAEGADCLIILTEWDEFKKFNFDRITNKMRNKYIFDGRNIYDKTSLKSMGFNYICIGSN